MKISCVVNAYVSRWHIFTTSWKEPIFVFVVVCVIVFIFVFVFVFVFVLVSLLVITLGEKILRCQRQRPKVANIFTGGISGGISTMQSPLNISLLYLETSLVFSCLVLSSFERGKCQRLPLLPPSPHLLLIYFGFDLIFTWVRGPVFGSWPMSLTCSMLRLNWCVVHSWGCKRNWSAFNQTIELMSVDFVNARSEKEEGPPNTWAQLAFSAGLYLRSF